MQVNGTVLNWKNGKAQVKIPAGACANCEQNCPSRSMAHPGVIEVDAESPLAPGEPIEVEVNLPSTGRAVFLAYLLPLAGFLIGLLVGDHLFGESPLRSLLLGLVGIGLAYGLVALLERRRRKCGHTVAAPKSPRGGGDADDWASV